MGGMCIRMREHFHNYIGVLLYVTYLEKFADDYSYKMYTCWCL